MLDKHKEIRRKHAGENFNRRVHTTLAKQLGLFVILYSPLQMAADLIENYEGHPAFKFIEDVPVNWEKSIVINGEIGEYITMARKDIHSPNWFLGSITNEEDREFKVKLDFLDENITYHAEIYKDGLNADWKHHPTEYEIDHKEVKKNDKLRIELAPGGGMAVKFYPTED
jgi:alpha-glucosidase